MGGQASVHPIHAKYGLGQVLRHRTHRFRGVVFDVDPSYSRTEDWYQAIPEHSRPRRDQPFYHLLAENDQGAYVAYVSEQNLVPDTSGQPVDHPDLGDLFGSFEDGHYLLQAPLN
nr:heat shock protein HspQ [Rubellimicrobium mesophilum]